MPDTIQELKRNITQEINSITLCRVMNSTVKRTHCCLTNNGGHLKDIVFLTLESPFNLNEPDLFTISSFMAIIF